MEKKNSRNDLYTCILSDFLNFKGVKGHAFMLTGNQIKVEFLITILSALNCIYLY